MKGDLISQLGLINSALSLSLSCSCSLSLSLSRSLSLTCPLLAFLSEVPLISSMMSPSCTNRSTSAWLPWSRSSTYTRPFKYLGTGHRWDIHMAIQVPGTGHRWDIHTAIQVPRDRWQVRKQECHGCFMASHSHLNITHAAWWNTVLFDSISGGTLLNVITIC